MKRKITALVIAMLMVAVAVVPVLAQPPVLPCTWYGRVTFDGNPVANGTVIRAKVGTTVVGTTTTSGADYSMLVPQEGGVPAEGATVNFYVVIDSTEYLGGSDTWNSGAFKELNLAAVSGPRYTLTISVSPAGSGTTNPAAGTHTYAAGTVVTVTATPNAGYRFANWSGDATGTSATITVTMDRNKSITANFIAVYTLTVTVNPPGSGTVTKSPNQAQYDAGTVVTVTATPASGYRFVNWSGDATGTSRTITVTMNANKSITANFEESVTPPAARNFAWWLYETLVAPLME